MMRSRSVVLSMVWMGRLSIVIVVDEEGSVGARGSMRRRRRVMSEDFPLGRT